MDDKKTFLCTPTERYTNKVVGPDYTIEAIEWYCARSIASDLFKKENNPPKELDWFIDSMEI